MSLIHWWPLTANLNSLVSSSSLDGTYASTDGKIGKCLSTGVKHSSTIPMTEWNPVNSSVSMSCWLKISYTDVRNFLSGKTSTYDQPTGNVIGYHSYGGLGIIWYANSLKNFSTLYLMGHIRGDGANIGTSAYTIPDNQWIHLALVADNAAKTLRFYVNGSVHGTASHSNLTNITSMTSKPFGVNVSAVYGGNGPSYSIPMKINDVRLYNHALSKKEIQELSRALVLHYTFDNASFENTTNVSTVNDWSTYSSYWTISERTNSGLKLYRHTGSTSDCVAVQNSAVTGKMAQGDIWTFSCYLYKNGQPFKSTASGISNESYGYKTVSWESHDDGYYRITFQVTGSPGAWVLHNYFFSPIDIGVNCEMRYMQFEKKDHATPYTANTRVGVIGDSSGFGNDGELNLPQYYKFTTDSRLGMGGLHCSGETSSGPMHIKTKLNPSFIAGTGSICFWYKKDSVAMNYNGGNFIVATPDRSKESGWLAATSANAAPTNNSNCSWSTWYYDGIAQNQSNSKDTEWHFYCATGVNISNWTTFQIHSHGDASWLYRGVIADYRVYNTILSADDVKELYNTRWAANKDAQVFSNAINEGKSKYQITKSGVVNCNTLTELSDVYEILDYVEATSDRMIDTGVPFDPNVDGVEFEYSAAVAQANYFIAGCGSSGLTAPYLWLYHYTGVSGFNAYVTNTSNSQVGITGFRGMDTNKHIIKYYAKTLYCDGTQTGSTTASLKTSMGNLKLFNTATNNSTYATRGKIYWCKVWKEGVLVRNMIPAKRVRDGVTGFLDSITKQFFTDNAIVSSTTNVRQDKNGNSYCNEFNEI